MTDSAYASIWSDLTRASFAQGYLDAVNHPNFPSTVVTPQKPMHEVTVFKFSTR